MDGRKRYENDKCGRKSFRKRIKTAPFSVENGGFTPQTTTTLLNQIILDNGWPTPQIAGKKANRGGASQIKEHTY